MFNESFPLVRVRVSSRDPPYMSPLVKHLCKIRNKTAHLGNQAENIIRQEKINALIRMNQVNAVNNERLKHNRGSKGWWDTANRITGRKIQGTLVSSVIPPDVINTYFQTINTDDEYEAPTRLQIPAGTRLPTVNECDVRNLLSHQKRTASGPDEFPYWLWRDYSHHLAPVITKIFNCSLRHQTVPCLWKLANVSPIPKESPLTECNQLRPISLTNIIMRIFERLVCKQEVSPILKSAIGPDQFAYKKGHNTTMALIKCQHFWLERLDRDAAFVRAFSFDFSKAFDSVSHRILFSKLASYDINPYIKNWIISFLCDRRQRVVVDGLVTSFLNVNRGVPQGTVLGPLLFSIMVNDIKPVSPQTLLIKYADDITASVPVTTGPNLTDSSHYEVENIKRWADKNLMTLNMKKTFEMVVKGKTTMPLPEPVDGIIRKSELKLLGVTVNEDPCNWDVQFENMLSKASSRLYILRVCKYYGFSLQELTLLFDSLITSLFTYAIEVWASAHYSKYLSHIDKFCKRALRYGYTSKYTPITDVIRMKDRLLWEEITSDSANPLHELLPAQRARSLRKRGHNYILPPVRTERFKRCFLNRCLFEFV